MEFWGIEIKPGSPLKVEPEDGYMIHVSQISLGELKKVKEDENVGVYVNVGDDKNKLLLGNLSQKIPQVSLDLFFGEEFELSHGCKSSVYLLGYKTPDVMDDQDENVDSDFDSDEEGIPMESFMNELAKSKANGKNDEKANESDDSGEEEDEMGSEEEDESDEEEEASLKVEPPSKKRPNGGAMNNNTAASKKAKVAIQQKPSVGAGGKKGKKCCNH